MKRLFVLALLFSLLSSCSGSLPAETADPTLPLPSDSATALSETAAPETEPPVPEPEPGFTVFAGECRTGKAGVTSQKPGAFALYTRSFSEGTVTGTLTPGSLSKTGVVFRVSEDRRSYYLFGINASKQVFFSRVAGGRETVVSAMTVSAGYNGTDARSFRIVAQRDAFYCYLNDNCYVFFRDPEPLDGTGVGFSASAAGATLSGFSLRREEREPLHADVLIWGHSHMQLWSQSKTHLASLGKVQNFGVGGSSTVYWLPMIDELCSYTPEYMIVMIGSNDYASASAAGIAERTAAILAALRERMPQVKIILLTEFLQPARLDYADKVNELNTRYKAFAAEENDLVIADLYDIALDKNGQFEKARFRDNSHLKETYYTQVRDRVLAAAKTFGPHDGAQGYEILSGACRTDDAFLSAAGNSLLLNTDFLLPQGTLEATVSPSGKSGLVFAAGASGSSRYLFSLENGVPRLEKNGVLLAENSAARQSAPCRMKVRFAAGRIECFANGVSVLSFSDPAPLAGDRFGFFAAGEGAAFSRIRFEKSEGDGRFVYPLGDSAAWTVTQDEKGGDVFVCNTPGAPILFADLIFEGGTVELDMTADHDTTDAQYCRFKTASGVLFAAEDLRVDHSAGIFYLFGRCPWGTCTGYSKHREPGAARASFHWEDTNKSGTKLAVGREYHYKIVWDPAKQNVTLSVNGKLFSVSPLRYALEGKYAGLCADVVDTRYRNVVFSPGVY
ncbi:MAG: hypothetical protein II771_04705 [Clostridia bacterium]|nr:hypothetical protein [Clostridia bacterium]